MYLSSFLLLLVILILLVSALLFLSPIKAAATFNSEQQPDAHLMMSWLNPFIKVYFIRHNGKATLSLNLLNRRILVKDLAAKKVAAFKSSEKNYIDYLKAARLLKINNARIFASYGFEDPSVTGLVYGAIELIAQYVNPNELNNNAGFFVDETYFNISASVEINVWLSLMRILRSRVSQTKAHALIEQR